MNTKDQAGKRTAILRREIIKVLVARHITLTATGREHLDACLDLKVLERWYERALVATAEHEVFRPWSERPASKSS